MSQFWNTLGQVIAEQGFYAGLVLLLHVVVFLQYRGRLKDLRSQIDDLNEKNNAWEERFENLVYHQVPQVGSPSQTGPASPDDGEEKTEQRSDVPERPPEKKEGEE